MKAVRIFLVDDDNIFVFLAKRIIAECKVETEVTVFVNGQDAFNFLKETISQPELLPDIIFLDLNMPIMDGWEFLEEYINLSHKPEKQISIYVVSSSISPLDVAKGKQMDIVTDFIIKPIYRERIHGLIEKLNT